MSDDGTHLQKANYLVTTIPLALCQVLVRLYHYSGGGANTATFRHGLMDRVTGECVGAAWWIPPTKSAAQASWDGDWKRVLSLHRLVVKPNMPTNAASFLIGRSIRLIRQDGRWGCLVTYADTGQGHLGGIYRATNWEYVGLTTPEAQWVDSTGRFVARKAGPKTRTKGEMQELGYRLLGRYSKHKYRMILDV